MVKDITYQSPCRLRWLHHLANHRWALRLLCIYLWLHAYLFQWALHLLICWAMNHSGSFCNSTSLNSVSQCLKHSLIQKAKHIVYARLIRDSCRDTVWVWKYGLGWFSCLTSMVYTDANGGDVEVQEVPISKATKTVQDTLHENGALPRVKHVANAELVFIAELPPLGYATFRIGKKARSKNTGSHKSVVTDLTKDSRWNKSSSREDDLLHYSKGAWTATLSASTGRLTALESR